MKDGGKMKNKNDCFELLWVASACLRGGLLFTFRHLEGCSGSGPRGL